MKQHHQQQRATLKMKGATPGSMHQHLAQFEEDALEINWVACSRGGKVEGGKEET